MTRVELQELANEMLTKAKSNLEDHGKLVPVCIFLNCKGEQQLVLGLIFDSNESKRAGCKMIEQKIAEVEPAAIITINDAWFKVMDQQEFERRRSTGISTDSERKECIIVSVSSRDGEDIFINQLYHRDQGKIVWDEVINHEGDVVKNNMISPLWKSRPTKEKVASN